VCLVLMETDDRQLGVGVPLVTLSTVNLCLLVATITGLETVFL
jgi:hypothetical protein